MSRRFLRVKSELLLEKEHYVLERQCSDGVWVLRHKHTERLLERTTAQLLDDYANGKLVFGEHALRTISGSRERRNAVSRKEYSANLKDAEIQAAKLRMSYVRAVLGLPYSKNVIEKAIEMVWMSLNPPPKKKPGWISVYRWTRAYLDSGATPNALVAADFNKGNREPRFHRDLIDICATTIETVYLTRERPTTVHTLNIAKAETRAANLLLPQSGQLVMPTLGLMQRLIRDIPAYDRDAARYGRESARKKYRTVLHHRLSGAPLQRGEIDHTRMDLFVIDDIHGLPLGRPWLTVLVDDFTRCILGYCLSFEPPSRATVARCLRHAFMPKSHIREEYPDLKNDWNAFGIVSELVLDGGAEFYSNDLEKICFELGIEQHFSPRKTPWFKGKVERLQGTLNRGVSVATHGKTFGCIVERADYDPTKHAVVTFSALRHLLMRWIVDVYHQKQHSALGCSPAKMWENNIRLAETPMMSDPLQFDAVVGGVESRVLTHKGIEYSGLLYNSPDMSDLRRHLGDRLTVEIRVDRSNLGSIIVRHPERGTPYRLPCLSPDYAEGLTEWQHGVCKRYSRETSKADKGVDAWLDSLLEISDIVSREMKLGKRKGVTRERIARWSESSQGKNQSETQLPEKSSKRKLELIDVPVSKKSVAVPAVSAQPTVPVMPTVERKRFKPVFEERSPNYALEDDECNRRDSHG